MLTQTEVLYHIYACMEQTFFYTCLRTLEKDCFLSATQKVRLLQFLFVLENIVSSDIVVNTTCICHTTHTKQQQFQEYTYVHVLKRMVTLAPFATEANYFNKITIHYTDKEVCNPSRIPIELLSMVHSLLLLHTP